MPLLLLFLAFTVLPLTELWLLLEVKGQIGIGYTLGLVVATGIVGAALARRQGVATLRLIQEEMGQGRLPTQGLLEGVLILFAGAVLVTPGILTDVLGFTLLIPPARRGLSVLLRRYVKGRISVQGMAGGGPLQRPPDDVIDAEVIRSGPVSTEPAPSSLIGTGETFDAEFEVHPPR
jgi:UPF0716 protein FxsA